MGCSLRRPNLCSRLSEGSKEPKKKGKAVSQREGDVSESNRLLRA
jgi:hypothetical protein